MTSTSVVCVRWPRCHFECGCADIPEGDCDSTATNSTSVACGGTGIEECTVDVEVDIHNRIIQVLDNCDSGNDIAFTNGGLVVRTPTATSSSTPTTKWSWGMWSLTTAFALLAEILDLDFNSLDCDEFQFSVDNDGQISQSEYDECDCVDFEDMNDYFCSDDFLAALTAEDCAVC